MKKGFLIYIAIVVAASLFTYGLKAIPAKHTISPPQTKKIHLEVEPSEMGLILKGLGKLPLEESGNLFLNLQQQAQEQMMPPLPKDTIHLNKQNKKQ